jgi:hypothetical protein
MRTPFETKDISNPEELFGRKQLLNNLLIDASLKQNINLIGARRFGKTCVLKSACTLLKQTENSTVYPVYIDAKSVNIKGTNAVYRYMLGILTESLYNDKVFTEPERFGNVDIVPGDDWTEIVECLESLSSSRIQSVFQRVVYFV